MLASAKAYLQKTEPSGRLCSDSHSETLCASTSSGEVPDSRSRVSQGPSQAILTTILPDLLPSGPERGNDFYLMD